MTARQIEKVVAAYFGIPVEKFRVRYQPKHVRRARAFAMWLIRSQLLWSYPRIGRHFQHSDHTTALHSIGAVDVEISTDETVRAIVEELKAALVHPLRRPTKCCPTCGLPVDRPKLVRELHRQVEEVREKLELFEQAGV